MNNSTRQQGFTLFEIIIVVLIIGIVATFASLRFTSIDKQREIKIFAQDLTNKLQLANQVAQLLPAELGFDTQQSSYQFYQLILNDNQFSWDIINFTHLLRPRTFSEQINLTIQSDPSRLMMLNENSQWMPSIQFFSNGQMTPFQITITAKGDSQAIYTISGNLSGQIVLQ